MKRILCIFVAMVILACMVGCYSKAKSEANAEEDSMFVIIEYGPTWAVVYHCETKVMYAISKSSYNCGTFTLLVNADGSPMIYEGK